MTIQVAIDGPAGAGKSTVAQQVAKLLQVPYIDTGAMYRSVTLLAMENGLSCYDELEMARIAGSLLMHFYPSQSGQRAWVGDRDVTEAIRCADVGALVSIVAKHAAVRTALVKRQQDMVRHMPGVVMDGRDIGTHVLPQAEVKIFLTATLEARASRRYEELLRTDYGGTIEDVVTLLRKRDEADGSREVAPMRPAPDAILVDTTDMAIEDVVAMIFEMCRDRTVCKEAE